jgi:alpha-tubulin suppressor-like RCC1 family protein
MLVIYRGKRSSRGSLGHAGKGRGRAAGPVLLAIVAAALCLAGPTAASAAQRPAGTALAWGYNGNGELGDGSTAASSTPVAVDLPAGTRVTAASVGDDVHSLAVTSDGSVLAWGVNYYGQLGDGSTAASSTPVAVDLPAGTRVTAVAAGAGYSLAVTSDGSVLAWGYNADGELGDGSTVDSSTPVAVHLPAGTRVTAVAADRGQSLAVTSDGSVLAWGSNVNGDLGDGSPVDSSTPVAVHLPAGVRVTAVAAGNAFSLAVTSDGSVLAWGNNYYGQLGDGSTAASSTPVAVDLPAGVRVTAVGAGDGQSLALTSDGSVLAWGSNQYGQLGDGSVGGVSSTPVAVDLPAGVRVTAVAAGTFYGLALTSDGSVLAWGPNYYGELGDGSTTDRTTPVAVDLPAGTRVIAVAAGGEDSLALAAPSPCWHRHTRPRRHAPKR